MLVPPPQGKAKATNVPRQSKRRVGRGGVVPVPATPPRKAAVVERPTVATHPDTVYEIRADVEAAMCAVKVGKVSVSVI